MTIGAVPLRAIIVDDDPRARERLRQLASRESTLEIVAECVDGLDAVGALRGSEVDLVFLDVDMPRLDGFGVVAEIGADRMPPIIFTSAYSQYAVRAFEAYALDYLLKPFDDARFAMAVARARVEVEARRLSAAAYTSASMLEPRLLALLEHLKSGAHTTYPEALAIRVSGEYVVVRVADIDWIEADGNYAKLYIDRRPRLITKTLTALEKDVLNPEVFVRVHRSAIVNTTKIAAAEPLFHGELSLVLRDGTRVQCSRRFRKRLEARLYFTS
jgi:two-component system LytT family response regulator